MACIHECGNPIQAGWVSIKSRRPDPGWFCSPSMLGGDVREEEEYFLHYREGNITTTLKFIKIKLEANISKPEYLLAEAKKKRNSVAKMS